MIHAGRNRFWSDVEVTEASAEGFGITLDSRPVRTPAKVELRVPSRALADLIAAEWAAVEDKLDPLSMPATQMSNSAIDKVRPQHQGVARMIADYGATDLLCYRADAPEALVRRQAEAWQPWLDWAEETLDAPLVVGAGVMHVAQPAQSLKALRDRVEAMDAFHLAAFHDLVTLSGSLVLGFAVARRALEAKEAWRLSRLDEIWQAEQWGEDAEAEALAETRKQAFLRANIHFHALGTV